MAITINGRAGVMYNCIAYMFGYKINIPGCMAVAQIAGFLTDSAQQVFRTMLVALFQKFGNSETLPNIVLLSDSITLQGLVLPTNLLFEKFQSISL